MRDDVAVTDPFAVPPAGAPTPEPPTAPLYGEPLRRPARNGIGTAALVLGVASVLFGWLIVPPVLAIVFGVVGMRRATRGEASNHGVALSGAIVGVLMLLLWSAVIALGVYVARSPAYDRWRACDGAAITTEQHDTCAQRFADELF
jgi:hypothetical protein